MAIHQRMVMVILTFTVCQWPAGTQERPEEPPIIQCQPNLEEGMVPENQTLRCQCQAQSLGKPEGVLMWSKKDDKTGKFEVLKEAEEGQSNLPFRAVLTRHNHTTKLRCGVQWGKEYIKSSIDVRVGYPASQVVLDINSRNPVVAEKSRATFKCRATDGRPPPILTLRKRGSDAELGTRNASLTYDWPDVRCEDSGTYTCTASNGMGPDKTVTSFLNVTCGPQGFSGQIPPFRYQGEEIQFTFDLVANPPPFKVTCFFLGSLEANSSSKVKGIVLSGRCERKSKTLVQATCTVTLSDVTSSGAAGLYRGSLTNGQGSLDFDFEVKLNVLGRCGHNDYNSDDGGEAKLAATVGGATGGVAVVIIVAMGIVIVILWKRRCGSMHAKTSGSREDDHTYTELDYSNPRPRIMRPGQLTTQHEHSTTRRQETYEITSAGPGDITERQYENTTANRLQTLPDGVYKIQ